MKTFLAGIKRWIVTTAIIIVAIMEPSQAVESDIRRDATVTAVEQVMPSVVNIATRTTVRDPQQRLWRWATGQPESFSSLGSGVIIDEAGYLLTNNHVVSDADQIGVQLNEGTNVYYEATIVARDPLRDVALLKLNAQPGEKFHAIRFAREDDLLLGETVLALGNPYGLGGTVTRGILSSKSRTMPKEGAALNIPNWIQTDAPINKGNSGGPLINLRGELIGINVAVVNQLQGEPVQGIGFAIPIRLVEEALSDIFPTESVKSFWFGARVKVGTSPLSVTTVQPESPAGRAGLKSGDTILQVNGKVPKSFIDFADLLAADPKSDVKLTIQRGTEQQNIPVRLVPESSVFNAELIRRRLGLTFEPLTPETAQLYRNVGDGFIITGVQEDGPAASTGLKNGILVRAIDGQVPADVTGIAKALYLKKKGEPAELFVVVRRQLAPNYVELVQATVSVPVR